MSQNLKHDQSGTQQKQPPRRRRRRGRRAAARRRILLLCAVVVFVGTALGVTMYSWLHSSAAPPASSPSAPISVPTPQPTVTTVHFSASGDNLIHDGLYLQAKARTSDGSYDFMPLYENIAPFFKDYDINWVNQETLISDELPPSSYPCFCTPGNVARTLYEIGFRTFALSNNHSYDQGAAGISSTLKFWASMPPDTVSAGFYAGESDYENIRTQTVKGITIAYLPYTELTNGIPTPSDAEANIIYTSQTDVIERQIQLARTVADIVIPCVHWGTENSHIVNDAQRALAQQMADWGADVIIGTHPHVVQPIEYVTANGTGQQVPVLYCLGNFVSLQNQLDNLIEIVATFDLTKTVQPDGSSKTVIENVKAHPLVMHYDAGWKNGRAYWLTDYTAELAAQHGNKAMNLDAVKQVLRENIDAAILVME